MAFKNTPYEKFLYNFNEILEMHYKNYGEEGPIVRIFSLVETIMLTLVKNKSIKILNKQLIDSLKDELLNKINITHDISPNDKEAIKHVFDIINPWVSMCHKYRHGKEDQINTNVPTIIFDFIFSTGMAIIRSLLEMNKNYLMNFD